MCLYQCRTMCVFHHPTAFRNAPFSNFSHSSAIQTAPVRHCLPSPSCTPNNMPSFANHPRPLHVTLRIEPALSLGQRCEYDASCKYLDKYSECAKEEQRCRCIHNYMPKVNTHGTSCIQSKYSLLSIFGTL